ncbi:MAG: methyltransferase domain-containing protein [Deltaproteobacteria bacterium]|nr:methyltransferase domain-containing protein [Deltaproteobacteria bacterium]
MEASNQEGCHSEGPEFSWSSFYEKRRGIRKRYSSVYELPLAKKLFDVVMGELGGSELILDVGASSIELGERIVKKHPSVIYKTMDIDRANKHDYYCLSEIKEKFDIIVLSEVIEHLDFEEGSDLLQELKELLKSGGRIIISTPNLNHPTRYWEDTDHKTPYGYESLGALAEQIGFNLKVIYRTYNDQFLKRLIRIYLMGWLHKYLGVDYAKSIVLVGEVK